MKNLAIALLITTTLGIFGYGFFVISKKNTPVSNNLVQERVTGADRDGQDLPEIPLGADQFSGSLNSKYVEYSGTALEEAAGKKRVLFFYANWCPTCRPADADFRANPNKIPPGAVVIRVNYNDTETDQEEKDLSEMYGVTYQHTFVHIDENGKELTKWNGGDTDELVENLK